MGELNFVVMVDYHERNHSLRPLQIDTAHFSLFLDFLDCLKSWGVELRQDPA